ncbi:MAG: glutamate--tRNA ligase [Chloroflexi bacterium]|nr:glutamate--tRNA ligase [Chloroflexota bacterium]
MTVRVRFAPSPTGKLHIGSVRTVVFNWLFAHKMGGQFILRIEDTDRDRYDSEALSTIMDGLRWLGLDWDEGPDLEELQRVGMENAEAYAVGGPYGPYIQSGRLEMYKQVAEGLIEQGVAYRCNCSSERLDQVREEQRARKKPPMYDRHCRDLSPDAISPDEPHVIRLKVPFTGKTVVPDAIRGDVVFKNSTLDDLVLLKTDGFPTYHLAVVVDDHHMGITHVTRDDRWISTAPKRVLLYQALDWEIPVLCHLPLVNGTDGRPLSKRHGSTSIVQFHELGYLPEALFNFLTFLGWAPGEGEEREIFSREELTNLFDLFRINKSPAVFSYKKLDWMNGIYIRNLSEADLLEQLLPFWQKAGFVPEPCPEDKLDELRPIIPLVQERLKRLNDVVESTTFLFQEVETPSAEDLVGKKMTMEESLEALRRARSLLAKVEPFEAEAMEQSMRALADDLSLKAGQLFGILRCAVTGQKVAPPLFGSLALVGQELTLSRLDAAEAVLAAAV